MFRTSKASPTPSGNLISASENQRVKPVVFKCNHSEGMGDFYRESSSSNFATASALCAGAR